MRLTIESTDLITWIDGVPVRVWRGRTESGKSVDVFVHRLASADPAVQAELERELVELELAEIEARRLREQVGEN